MYKSIIKKTKIIFKKTRISFFRDISYFIFYISILFNFNTFKKSIINKN